MSATNLTASIAGTIYPVLNTTYTLDDKVDERSTVQLTIFDANNTYSFLPYQPITITDSLEGVKFTGFVSQPVATKYDANNALSWQLACVDNEFLAGKKTSNRVINNQYAGIAAVSMVNDYLSQDGIVANYAIRDDNTQSDFTQGTLSGTVATSNNGGDLELSLAGSTVTILENTTAEFNTGTPNNVTAASNSLSPTTTSAIKMVCTQSVPGGGNSYTYVKIWKPSGTFAVVNGRFFAYDVWIDSSSPECKFGVDIVFTDGTNVRDSAIYYDVQNIPPHPKNDLSGVAKGQWYHREFYIDNFAGKNIAYLTIACEGDTTGTYTAYFKNINYENSDHSFNQAFFASSFNVSPPQQMQTNGYSNTQLSIVNTIDTSSAYRYSPSYSIDTAKIIKSSFITWQETIPTGDVVTIKYSIDGGDSYATCTNNAPLPNLPAGMSVSGKSIIFAQEFIQSSGLNPEQPDPTTGLSLALTSMECVIQPSYTASKTDVLFSTATGTWGSGTLTNTTTNAGLVANGVLNLIGAVRNYDDGNSANQTLYGGGASGAHSQGCNQKAFSLTVDTSDQAVSRMDFAGTFASGTLEVDIYVDNANAKIGVTYLTTNWSNYDANYAYSIEVTTTSITLNKGSNSSAASNGTRTQLATASLTLSSGTWHHLKVVFSSGSHTISFDDIQMLTSSDATYSSAGYPALRVSNSTGSTYSAQFDNFGVVKSLSGTYVSPSTSISSATTYGNSVVWWADDSSNSNLVTLLVEAKINSGSYNTCTNGGAIPGLTVGQSLSGVTVTFRVTLTTSAASAMPGIQYFNAYILGQFSSSGTRIAPFLPLTNALIAGSTLTSWVATTPANTSVAVSTSLDGVSYSSATNGGQIVGITAQPTATLDTFGSNSSPSYLQTIRTGGTAGVFFWDTLNSRLSVSGGTNALLLLVGTSCANVDMILDFDQSDQSGLVWRWADASDFYELDVFDGSSSAGATNIIRLFKVASNVKTQLGSDVAVTLTRGYKYRLHLSMIGTAINVWIDGVNLISTTDSSLSAAGQVGIIEATGIGRFYNFRVQPQGDNLSGKVVYSQVTLTSTDPTQTPQLTDLTVAALHPNIGIGSLIPNADYTNTYISDNLKDLAKKSDYTTYFDQNLNFIFGPRVAQPAPWILQSADPKLLIDGPLTVDYSADLYRNEMVLQGVIATGVTSETKIGDGTSTSWNLGGILIAQPTILLNGQTQTVGIKGIDTGKNFYWTPNSTAINQDPSGTVLQQTDTLSFPLYEYQYTTSITVDNTNLAGTITQKQFAARMGRSYATQTVLNQASAAQTTSADFGDLDVSKCRRITVDINITAVSGSSPVIQFFIDRKGVDGNYYNIWSSSSGINSTGVVSRTIGAFAETEQALGSTVKLRWTIGGSTPSFTFSASIIGILDVQSAGLGIVAVVEDVTSQSLNVAAATAYGNTLLQRYGVQGALITCKTWRRNPSLAIGQYLPVFIPEHNLNDASMLITEISTVQEIGYETSSNPTQVYYQTLTLTSSANLGSAWRLLATAFK